MLIYWRLSIKKSPSTCILPVIMATWVFHRIEIQGKRDQQFEQENGSPTLRNPYISWITIVNKPYRRLNCGRWVPTTTVGNDSRALSE